MVKQINEWYDTDNSAKEEIRSFEFLDQFRHPSFPDDIVVLFLRGDNNPEKVWVTANHLSDQKIMGELLNEPNQDFGVHKGDTIRIIPYQDPNGKMLCFSSFD